jgi:flagellar motility protein MotE (MotC chaperone)
MQNNRIKFKPILISLILIKIAATCYFFSDRIKIFDVFLGHQQAFAQDNTNGNTTVSTSDNSPESTEDTETKTPPIQSIEKKETDKIKAALEGMEQKRISIKEEEKRLEEKIRFLEKLKQEIEEKLVTLEKMQSQAEKKLTAKATRESEEKKLKEEEQRRKIKQLVKVFSSMKPKDAGPVIEKLNIDVAKQIFLQMKGEQAGKILSYISKNRAAEISEELIAKNNRQ